MDNLRRENLLQWFLLLFFWVNLGAQHGLFKLTMKLNTAQAMFEIVALASNKVNPSILNPPHVCGSWSMHHNF
jgi:hypothetical protein